MHRITVAFVLMTLALGCASGQGRPASIPQPEIDLRQVGPIFFGSGVTTAPVTFEIDVTNRAADPLEVTEIELNSLGGAQFEILTKVRRLRERIAPGETRTISVSATAVSRTVRGTPTEPMSVRGIVTFETPDGRRFREIIIAPLLSSE
ncbi:MAG TPA: hypothetical protein VMS56_09125 [Thermoanaerobaculia bacterium]|nr:hypothetical protein [Thermoanaerobaculia bacterium]